MKNFVFKNLLFKKHIFFQVKNNLFQGEENLYKVANVLKKAKSTLDIAIFALTNDTLKKV